jgi:hypothetical protein
LVRDVAATETSVRAHHDVAVADLARELGRELPPI